MRCWALITRSKKRSALYWYNIGYGRTCSYEYDPNDKDDMFKHLTNGGFQKKGRLPLFQ